MKIEKIKIKKFKSISSIVLDLGPINYLVGGNNAGKSSVLQAIHTAVTAAQTSAELQWKIISDGQIKYCPTGNFSDIGYNGPLENMQGGNRAIIAFEGLNDSEERSEYTVELYKGRNSGAGVERFGSSIGFGSYIIKSNPPFSVYVPGLAGIPHFEEYKNIALIIRKIAGGEANYVLRNILLQIKIADKLDILKERMKEVFPDFSISISFEAEKHQHISVAVSTKATGQSLPLDLTGTGVLQALQLFAYTILFEPALLLLDEPDSHLHPSNQLSLIQILQSITQSTNTKIIMATHSRHMINNIPSDAKMFWLENGRLKQGINIDRVKLLNDLGALDHSDEFNKEVLILTEDDNKANMNKLLRQIAAPVDKIGIVSYNGISNFKIAIQLAKSLLNDSQKIIIHRDRDFLTSEEVSLWEADVVSYNVIPYTTEGSDLEMCFLSTQHLAKLVNKTEAEVENFVKEVITENNVKFRRKFKDKRAEHNKKLYQDSGGSPSTILLCPPDQDITLECVLGKELISRLRADSDSKLGVKLEPTLASDVINLAPNLQACLATALNKGSIATPPTKS